MPLRRARKVIPKEALTTSRTVSSVWLKSSPAHLVDDQVRSSSARHRNTPSTSVLRRSFRCGSCTVAFPGLARATRAPLASHGERDARQRRLEWRRRLTDDVLFIEADEDDVCVFCSKLIARSTPASCPIDRSQRARPTGDARDRPSSESNQETPFSLSTGRESAISLSEGSKSGTVTYLFGHRCWMRGSSRATYQQS